MSDLTFSRSFIFCAIFLLTLIGLSSCRPKLDLAANNQRLQVREAKMLFSKLNEKKLDLDWLSGKIDSKSSYRGEEQEFTTNFRMKKDSLLWMSISKLGVEGFRINISQDTVMFMDKIKKTYFVGDHAYLQQMLKIEDLDLDFVQNILLGEPVLLNDDDRWKGEIDSTFYVLKNVPGKKLRKALGIEKDEDFDLPSDSLYLYYSIDRKLGKVLRKHKENDRWLKRYFLDEQFHLVKMLITDVPNNRLLEISYHDFGVIDSLYLPQRITVDIKDIKETTHLELLYTKLKTEIPESVPFKIPEKYEPIKP